MLNNYSFEHLPTYIANHVSYKICSDSNIYKKIELKSTFIEIINPRKLILLLVSYTDTQKCVDWLQQWLLKQSFEKINQEQKKCFF